MSPRFDRQSGIFLHLTALPGERGIGTLGEGAYQFVDFLADADQSLWQICPTGPTSSTHGNSPYMAYSAFAGNPLLIDLDTLVEDGWLDAADLEPTPDAFSPHSVDFDAVRAYKEPLLRQAAERFWADASDEERDAVEAFRRDNADWLDDYVLFMSLKEHFDGAGWTDWPAEVRHRDPDALENYREELADEIRYREFVQFVFAEQWADLKDYANDHGVQIVGDLPIYVGHDSADVWANPEAFQMTDDLELTDVAGVPPNDDEGQIWGNPLYDWGQLEADDFEWWRRRFAHLFDTVDITRIDHFPGFARYYAIPADADHAREGEWRPGPGAKLFEAVRDEVGDLPIVVEDLGFLFDEVVQLREQFSFPGMNILQFAEWCEEDHMYLPHTYAENSVAYTGTHDMDTIVGWYADLPDEERDCLHYYLGTDGAEINWDMIEAAWDSPSCLAIVPMQDVLGLGSEARFNVPGTLGDNWAWRVTSEGLADDLARRLARLNDFYAR